MRIATFGLLHCSEPGHCFDRGVLLAEKKPGEEIGAGKLTGPGGKVQKGETPEECLIRETREEWEIGLDSHSLQEIGIIDYHIGEGEKEELYMRVHNFRARILSGTPHETERFHAPACYPIHNLPFDRMFEADRHWLPQATHGIKFHAVVHYRERAKGLLGTVRFLPCKQ